MKTLKEQLESIFTEIELIEDYASIDDVWLERYSENPCVNPYEETPAEILERLKENPIVEFYKVDYGMDCAGIAESLGVFYNDDEAIEVLPVMVPRSEWETSDPMSYDFLL